MATITLTIGGSAKSIRQGSLRLSETTNGRSTLAVEILSTDGTYRPALGAEVILEVTVGVTTTRIFGGLVDRATEVGAFEYGFGPGIAVAVNAVDFNEYTNRRFVNATIPEGTLKARLTYLVDNYLDDYGVVLLPGQVDGPTIPEVTYRYTKLSDVLNESCTLTANAGETYAWQIEQFKLLRAYQPSGESAPFDITGDPATNVVASDIEIEEDRNGYANRVIVLAPTVTENAHPESFTGDGSSTVYPLQYTMLDNPGIVHTAGGGGETLSEPGGGGQWEYDASTNELTRVAGATTNALVYTVTFNGTYSGEATAEDAADIAANGVTEMILKLDSVPLDETLEALASNHLARVLPVKKTAKYGTFQFGLRPGQVQTINIAKRNINTTAVITDLVTEDRGPTGLYTHVTAVLDSSASNLGRDWRDTFKTWAGDKSGGAASAVTSRVTDPPPTGGVAGPPVTSVQFNRLGSLGGVADFTFQEAGNNLVVGTGSTITATDADSCFVFGNNCHIEDP